MANDLKLAERRIKGRKRKKEKVEKMNIPLSDPVLKVKSKR